MMTKEEAQAGVKDEEGDPPPAGAQASPPRDGAQAAPRREVRRADALVVNPTHIAIAIRYRKDEGAAPRVLAKGKGCWPSTCADLAREHGIPIVEDIPLARLLYKKVKVGGQVPAATYKAVAAILAFVYRVTGRSPLAQRHRPRSHPLRRQTVAEPRATSHTSLERSGGEPLALAVLGVIAILIIPVPAMVLDALLASPWRISVLMLLVALGLTRPMDFSVFPSLLLIITLFRLSLNVATTRLILLDGGEGPGGGGPRDRDLRPLRRGRQPRRRRWSSSSSS